MLKLIFITIAFVVGFALGAYVVLGHIANKQNIYIKSLNRGRSNGKRIYGNLDGKV